MAAPRTYRKKPVAVQALQWTGDNAADIRAFVGVREATGEPRFLTQSEIALGPFKAAHPVVFDELHQTWVNVLPGNWIIRGTLGEFYPCDAEVFTATYDIATETP